MYQNFFRNLRAKHWVLLACGAFLVLLVASMIGWWVADCLNQRGWKVDWGAWATFATGCMAIVGATWVGVKQADIQTKQLEILKNQVSSEFSMREREVRVQLWAERKKFITELESIAPGPNYETFDFYEFSNIGLSKMRDIRYLFSERVVDFYKGAMKKTLGLGLICKKNIKNNSNSNSNAYGKELKEDKMNDIVEFHLLINMMIEEAKIDV